MSVLSPFSPVHEYATWLPSGEKLGLDSEPGSVVRGTAVSVTGVSVFGRNSQTAAIAASTAAPTHIGHRAALRNTGPGIIVTPECDSSCTSSSSTFTSDML